MRRAPPHAYFVVSAVFHYLGPSFAVLLFARVQVLGVAWLRIASAALILGLWRRPQLKLTPTLLAWGAVLAGMNAVFYLAIDRLPLGTVAAIEFLPVIVLAALGTRTPRNLAALGVAVAGVYLLTDVRLGGEPLGFVFAFANALLFSLYIVLGHRVARGRRWTASTGWRCRCSWPCWWPRRSGAGRRRARSAIRWRSPPAWAWASARR